MRPRFTRPHLRRYEYAGTSTPVQATGTSRRSFGFSHQTTGPLLRSPFRRTFGKLSFSGAFSPSRACDVSPAPGLAPCPGSSPRLFFLSGRSCCRCGGQFLTDRLRQTPLGVVGVLVGVSRFGICLRASCPSADHRGLIVRLQEIRIKHSSTIFSCGVFSAVFLLARADIIRAFGRGPRPALPTPEARPACAAGDATPTFSSRDCANCSGQVVVACCTC
jgi:hypothetical protein